MQRGGWTSDSTLKNVYRHTLSDQTKQMNLIANNHFDTLCNTESNTQSIITQKVASARNRMRTSTACHTVRCKTA